MQLRSFKKRFTTCQMRRRDIRLSDRYHLNRIKREPVFAIEFVRWMLRQFGMSPAMTLEVTQ